MARSVDCEGRAVADAERGPRGLDREGDSSGAGRHEVDVVAVDAAQAACVGGAIRSRRDLRRDQIGAVAEGGEAARSVDCEGRAVADAERGPRGLDCEGDSSGAGRHEVDVVAVDAAQAACVGGAIRSRRDLRRDQIGAVAEGGEAARSVDCEGRAVADAERGPRGLDREGDSSGAGRHEVDVVAVDAAQGACVGGAIRSRRDLRRDQIGAVAEGGEAARSVDCEGRAVADADGGPCGFHREGDPSGAGRHEEMLSR